MANPFLKKPNTITPVVATAQAFGVERTIRASAARIDLKNHKEVDLLKKRLERNATWQKSALDFYELVGEIHYAANLMANITSRVRLFPGYVTSLDAPPSNIYDVPDDIVSPEVKELSVGALDRLRTGSGGIAGTLRDAMLNLFVAGECYLIREPVRNSFGQTVGEAWQIRSIDEIKVKSVAGGAFQILLKNTRYDTEEEMTVLGYTNTGNPEEDLYFNRIWNNHPRYSGEADSSLRPQLENLEMLLLYDRAKRSIVKSRLNAGMLLLPDGLTNAFQNDGEIPGEADTDIEAQQEASFEEELMDALITPISDESSASAVVPVFARGPLELLNGIKLLSFSRPFDAQITTDSERILDRIMQGLNLPKEVLSGIGGLKYAASVQIEESLFKAHIEPMILAIVDSLTVLLVKPILAANGVAQETIDRMTIWYDPSDITVKPSKAEAADTGYQNMVLSADAWRKAHGFGDEAAPTGLEILQRTALAKGLLSEPVTERALRSLDPTIFDEVREQQMQQSSPEAIEAIDNVLNAEGTPGTSANNAPTPQPEKPPVPLMEP